LDFKLLLHGRNHNFTLKVNKVSKPKVHDVIAVGGGSCHSMEPPW